MDRIAELELEIDPIDAIEWLEAQFEDDEEWLDEDDWAVGDDALDYADSYFDESDFADDFDWDIDLMDDEI